jgi:hypothetical protein
MTPNEIDAGTRDLIHRDLDRILDNLPMFGKVKFSITIAEGKPTTIDREISRSLRLDGRKS